MNVLQNIIRERSVLAGIRHIPRELFQYIDKHLTFVSLGVVSAGLKWEMLLAVGSTISQRVQFVSFIINVGVEVEGIKLPPNIEDDLPVRKNWSAQKGLVVYNSFRSKRTTIAVSSKI